MKWPILALILIVLLAGCVNQQATENNAKTMVCKAINSHTEGTTATYNGSYTIIKKFCRNDLIQRVKESINDPNITNSQEFQQQVNSLSPNPNSVVEVSCKYDATPVNWILDPGYFSSVNDWAGKPIFEQGYTYWDSVLEPNVFYSKTYSGRFGAERKDYRVSFELTSIKTTENCTTYGRTCKSSSTVIAVNEVYENAICASESELQMEKCGNSICDNSETLFTCPQDCAERCGDQICNEDPTTCSQDCGPSVCGDGKCTGYPQENYSNCAKDCYCGDGLCEPYEQATSCPIDCDNYKQPYCGNGTCSGAENITNCPQDCSTPGTPSVCGDKKCTGTETKANCPQDCSCGDGTCDLIGGEDYDNCPLDCKKPVCGDGKCNGKENEVNCAQDCGTIPVEQGFCGDGECSENENRASCLTDCFSSGKNEECLSGPDAMPRSKFVWEWDKIGPSFCDADNPEGVFCDATQFMIAFTNKLEGAQNNSSAFDNWQVLLKADNFSSDWKNDFVEYYKNKDITTSTFFKNDTDGIWKRFSRIGIEGVDTLGRKSSGISTPGTYKVTIQLVNNDYKLPDSIKLIKINDDEKALNNAFNWFSFDGKLGFDDQTGKYKRDNYGTAFGLESDEDFLLSKDFAIPKPPIILATYQGLRLLKLQNIIQANTGMLRLNSFTHTDSDALIPKGTILKVILSPGLSTIYFSPLLADPLLIKEALPAQTSGQNYLSYDLLLGGNQMANNENNAQTEHVTWDTLEECTDPLGKNEQKQATWTAFKEKNHFDLFVGATEPLQKNSNFFFKTIFYTPVKMYSTESHLTPTDTSGVVGFIDETSGPSNPLKTVQLNGVAGVPFNSPSQKISSVEDVFELVKQGYACVKTLPISGGVVQEFLWNEQKLFDELGTQINVAQQQCEKPVTDEKTLKEGESYAGLYGTLYRTQVLLCQPLSLRLASVQATGPTATSYSAKFELLDSTGKIIGTHTGRAGEDLSPNFVKNNVTSGMNDSVIIKSIGVGAADGAGEVALLVYKGNQCPL